MIQGFRQFGPLSVSKELGVEGDHLHREGNFVCDALTGSVATGKKLQIRNLVESSVSIFVVNRLLGMKRPADVSLHNDTMFEPLALGLGFRTWDAEVDVSTPHNTSAFRPIFKRSVLGPLGKLKGTTALLAANFVSRVRRAPILENGRNDRTALNAGLATGVTLGDAHALGRTVEWVSAVESLVVAGKFSRVPVELGLADRAREFLGVDALLSLFVGLVARAGAEFESVVKTLSHKFLTAMRANVCSSADGHLTAPSCVSRYESLYTHNAGCASPFELGVA